ncbi:MAG: LLM class flavin-dependent oxidoreductase [Ignavibacteriaceae bacterium]|jgi:probable LLM family oxidoreductase|nr:LLM class flavin-dependent oxidoreductase [Ignavibacteriaceae bacterium]
MELGIGMFGDLTFNQQTKQYQSTAHRHKEIIEEIKLADELGIDVFAMGEHHREDYSVSAPEIMLAALSSVTKNIKLSSGVNVISSTDPVKLYQDFSMIDLMSDGRAEIMAGRGSFIESFPLFGYNLDDYNDLFTEKLELLLELRKNKKINWKGQFRPPIVNQTVYPLPEREIPVWIAVGGTPTSVVRAARLGLPIIFAIIGGTPIQFKPLIDYYKEQYVQSGHDPKEMQVAVHSHTFIADSKEEVLKDYYLQYAYSMNKIGRERGWSEAYTPEKFKAGMRPDGALYMGSAEDVTEKIINTIEMFGLTRYIAHIDVGGPAHKQILKTIELYGTKVLPAVKKHFK